MSRRGTRGVALVALLLAPQWTSQGPAGWSRSGAGGWVCGGSRGRGWLLWPGFGWLAAAGEAWVALRAPGSGTGYGEAEKGDALRVRSPVAFPQGKKAIPHTSFPISFPGQSNPVPRPFPVIFGSPQRQSEEGASQ